MCLRPKHELLNEKERIINELKEAFMKPFGDRSYLVRTVPAMLHKKDWAGVLRELWDTSLGKDKRDWLDEIAISIACHSAVRAGQVLSDDEMRQLVRQLEQATIPNTCP